MALWTPDKLQRVREIIAKWHAVLSIAVFGVKSLPPDLLKDLRAAGVEIPKGAPLLIDNAFAYGQLVALLRDPKLATKSPTQIADLVIERKLALQLTPSEQASVDVARQHAGQYVVGLGTRVAGQVMAAVTGAEANLTPERMVEIIRDKTAGNIARRETIDSLRSDLGHAMGNWTRDWQRIAMTESNNAIQEGTAAVIEREHGADELVSKIPRPSACPDCRRLYMSGGEPIIFKLSQLRANGSNVGRKKQDWKATVEAIHPWCGCVLARIPAGMIWEGGELVPGDIKKSELSKAARKLHGRMVVAGMQISVENRKGSYRHWYDPVAKENGSTKVRWPYGYIRLTEGADGDHVDVYVGPDRNATKVFVVHQRKKHKDGSFGGYDEDKCMLQFGSAKEAKAAYLQHYNDPRFFGSMTAMTVPEFKRKLIEKKGEKLTKAVPLVLRSDTLAKSYAPCVRCGEMSKESDTDANEPCWACRKALEAAGAPYQRLEKGGPYIGPKGGKWADPQHTVAWQEPTALAPDHEPKVGDEHEIHAKGMYPFTAHVSAVKDDGTVEVSQAKGSDYGVPMPKESVRHFVNDLRGVVHGPPSSDARVQAVLDGEAEHLGKGDDGIAFRVGDSVVKASTTVPYQPFNRNHLTPQAAAERMAEQVKTSNAMHDDGVPGIMRSELVYNGDKAFQIKPYVEIPAHLTKDQLDSVAASVEKAHEKGWVFNDDIQVGIHDGKLVHFDTGKAARSKPNEPGRPAWFGTDKDDDIRRLKDLYKQHGETYLTADEKADPMPEWEALDDAKPESMTADERKAHRGKILRHGTKVQSFLKRSPDHWAAGDDYFAKEKKRVMDRFSDPIKKGDDAIAILKSAADALEQIAGAPSRIGMMSWRGNEDSPRPERPADIVGITDAMGLTIKGRKKRKKAIAEAKAVARASRMSPKERFAPAKKMDERKEVQLLAPDSLKDAREGAREGAEEKRERIRGDLERRLENKPPMDPVRIARARGSSA